MDRDAAARRGWLARALAGGGTLASSCAVVLGCGCAHVPGDPPPATSSAQPAALAELVTGDAALRARLRAAIAARGPGYVPRTRHVAPDGSPIFVNRLILESSPYLLQHAHNPVAWFPWGEEAFELARKLGRPVFLSVGYSTCHWCHVMEEESFEDEEIARYLNDHYVPIKVDREERPDVDATYMVALQLVTGSGGWPMSLWLTPDRRPFHAGTYFPPRDGVRPGRRGLLGVLTELAGRFEQDPERITEASAAIATDLARELAAEAAASPIPGLDALAAASAWATSHADPTYGGSASAPKFPANLPLRALLRHAWRTGDREAAALVMRTLDHMARGGIHDHVGGGFHRYAVDARWLVPHFEKMLYDNAELAIGYLEAASFDPRPELVAVARDTLDYVARELRVPGGGFASATDADSLAPGGARKEGYYFTWTPAELDAALGPRAALARAWFAVSDGGNLAGRSVLHAPRPAVEVAAELGLGLGDFERERTAAVLALREARARRPPPLRDDKVQVDWNALAISAFARGALALGDASYATLATDAADFLERDLRVAGALRHSLADGTPGAPAFADDYALLSAAELDLFELTADPRWLDAAIGNLDVLERDFRAPAGGYYRTSTAHEHLFGRELVDRDGVVPSATSVAALCALRVAGLTAENRWRARGEAALAALGGRLRDAPHSLGAGLLALDFFRGEPREIAIVLPDGQSSRDPAARALLDELARHFVPSRVLVVGPEARVRELTPRLPWLEAKRALAGKATAYVCERGRCELPASDAAAFGRALDKRPAPPALVLPTPTP
ncbi:MAG: thioredoxin domain-containing protein [Myxococcales bacterium]|nr:thioredoxin domain-containing protein [Myxococcales bacterium]